MLKENNELCQAPSAAQETLDEAAPGFSRLEGGCGLAAGFRFSGLHCGIKKRRKDLALIVSDQDCSIAGMFTSNQVVAPPVRYCKALISAGGSARAVVINSGNANACTGAQGLADTKEMAQLTAEALGANGSPSCVPEQVYVCSTGVIGPRLPMDALRSGIPTAVRELAKGQEAADAAAQAILTTDTTAKTCSYRVGLSTGDVHIGGMAKGSGMIAPDLKPSLPHATTLAYLTTDAEIPAGLLQELLGEAMHASFNCITVDGDTSTNDTVLLLASGASGVGLEIEEDRQVFACALHQAALDLALMIVRDGEGAQRVIEVRVGGARCEADARRVARTVAESPLVKTAFCAGEPNWGRFLMAIGRSGVDLVEEELAVCVNGLCVVNGGMGTEHDPQVLRREMTRDDVVLAIDLGGAENAQDPKEGTASCWTCDLSEEYVRINGHYLT